VSTDAPEAVKDDPDAPEVLDVDDWQLQVDLLQLIKGGIIALLSKYLFLLVCCLPLAHHS
jgi:hypothetical protein